MLEILNEKEGEIRVMNPTKNSIPSIIEYQSQLKLNVYIFHAVNSSQMKVG